MIRVLTTAAIIAVTAAGNPFAGKRLYVDPLSPARRQAEAWARSRPGDAAHMRMIAAQSQAIWFGDWTANIKNEIDKTTSRIVAAGALPVYVVYNIPHRDCGLHSAGGARSGDDYRHWIREFAKGLKGRASVVILEPDAVPTNDCLPFRLKDERYVLLRDAAETLRGANAAVYIDAGNANWHQPTEIADRLRKSGIDISVGFALNIAKFQATNVNVAYGTRVSALVDGKHFVIDTGRNGTGATNIKEWCNARGQALGAPPTTDTRMPLVDALLWIKTPGQSDGTCNGGPRAGEWWADYALELSKMADALKIGPR